MKAMILAGGLGTRLRPLTDTIPKPLIRVANKPILVWQIEWLRRGGVDEFVLCISHLKEKIMAYFGDGSSLGVNVRYVVEENPRGTGGALHNAAPYFPKSEAFFALNGDVVTDLDLNQLARRRQETSAMAAIALVPLPSPYGEVVTDDRGMVSSFTEKPRLLDHWINGGVYCLHPSILSYLPDNGSIEQDVFPVLAREGKLAASKHQNAFWMSIDSPKDIEEAAKVLKSPRLA